MGKANGTAADPGRGATQRDRFWVGHLEKIEAEGIAAKDYAAREGLSIHALYQAKTRLLAQGAFPRARRSAAPTVNKRPVSRDQATSTFARVRVIESPPAAPMPWALRLRLPGGALLEWAAAPKVNLLAALLERVARPR
jgi:hypothetical protein